MDTRAHISIASSVRTLICAIAVSKRLVVDAACNTCSHTHAYSKMSKTSKRYSRSRSRTNSDNEEDDDDEGSFVPDPRAPVANKTIVDLYAQSAIDKVSVHIQYDDKCLLQKPVPQPSVWNGMRVLPSLTSSASDEDDI